MSRTVDLTVLIEREDDAFVSICPELNIASQGDTVEEARANLMEALEGFFAVANEVEISRRLAAAPHVERVSVAVG
jgi:predicted RNase H-like HicB family nuclease